MKRRDWEPGHLTPGSLDPGPCGVVRRPLSNRGDATHERLISPCAGRRTRGSYSTEAFSRTSPAVEDLLHHATCRPLTRSLEYLVAEAPGEGLGEGEDDEGERVDLKRLWGC